MRRVVAFFALAALAGCAGAPIALQQPPPTVQPPLSQDAVLFWLANAALAAEFPRPYPVEVRLEPIDGPYMGLTSLAPPGGLLVQVESRQPLQGRIDTLIHEWAHVAVFGAALAESHDDLWGVAFARGYRAVRRAIDALEQKVGGPAPTEASGGTHPSDSPGGWRGALIRGRCQRKARCRSSRRAP